LQSERAFRDAGPAIEWQYRVNDRLHIPDFFPAAKDNADVKTDKLMRFGTPLARKDV